jgi:hypothetical protein
LVGGPFTAPQVYIPSEDSTVTARQEPEASQLSRFCTKCRSTLGFLRRRLIGKRGTELKRPAKQQRTWTASETAPKSAMTEALYTRLLCLPNITQLSRCDAIFDNWLVLLIALRDDSSFSRPTSLHPGA